MKEDHASALENGTAKAHMPGTATMLKTIMARASEVKGMNDDKTHVQKMNTQAQLQNCTVEQLLDHIVDGEKSRLHGLCTQTVPCSVPLERQGRHQNMRSLKESWTTRG